MPQQRAQFRESFITGQVVRDLKPRKTFWFESMRGRHHKLWIIEGADVKFDDGSEFAAVALPGQRRAAVAAKCPRSTRRRLIGAAILAAEGHVICLISRECHNRCTIVFATTLAVAVIDREWRGRRFITHRATKAPTLH